MEENKLVKKAKKGDPEAFGKLYDKYISQIYRFVFLKVKGTPEAEDITQQVFLKTWQNIRNYKSKRGARFSSWLYSIARNTVIDYYRTSKEHADIEDVKYDSRLVTFPKFGEKLDQNKKIKQVEKSLSILTEDERDVIIMKFIEEFSNKEIGEILGKNQGTIRVIQYRALKKLKSYFKNYDQ